MARLGLPGKYVGVIRDHSPGFPNRHPLYLAYEDKRKVPKRIYTCETCGDPRQKHRMHCDMHYEEFMRLGTIETVVEAPAVKRINSKRKGNFYEGFIAKIVKTWFPKRNIRRTGIIQTIKAHGTGDLLGWPRVHAEIKDCKALSMFEWLRTMIEVCSQTGDMPVLFFRQPAAKGFKFRDEDWMTCRVADFPFLASDFMEQQKGEDAFP